MVVRATPALPRLLVDITPETRVEGETHLGLGAPLAAIAQRLLSLPDVTALPVLVRNGRLLALDADAARTMLQHDADVDAGQTVLRQHRRVAALPIQAEPGQVRTAQEPPPPPPPPPGLRLRVTGGLRRVARAAVASLPESIREDVRAVLIHARQAARTLVYGRAPTAPPPPEPMAREPVAREPALPNRPPPPSRPAARVPPPPLRASASLEVHPHPGDVLWTGGTASPWTAMRAISGLRAGHGLRIVTLAQDPPPLRGDGAVLVEATLRAELLQAADLIVTSSNAQANALRAMAADFGWHAPRISVLPAAPQPPEAPQPDWPDGLPDARFALVTGTVAPGSGHGRLLAIWEKLVEDEAFDLNLIILGSLGKNADGIAEAFESSALFGERIFWLDAAAEPLARRLHADCAVLICPGPGETWPTAVIETLWLGRPVVAARQGAIPPESLGLATLVDPGVPAAWQAAILAAAARRPDRPPPPMPDPAALEAALRGFLANPVPA